MEIPIEKRSWLDRPLFSFLVLNGETILFTLIVILGIVSRLYNLGERVISHDETIHVYHNSWSLYRGQGYRHDPLSHGPFQFHLMALSYFIFGANDFTARLPQALFSIATIAFIWFFRRYLGRSGALVGAAMFLISPYLLYYGRYARNEALCALFGVVTIWSILRYLETGKARYAYWLSIATVLNFASKETAFIYTAQALLFLAGYFVYRISKKRWKSPEMRNGFLISLMAGLVFLAVAGYFGILNRGAAGPNAAETASPAVPGEGLAGSIAQGNVLLPIIMFGLAAAVLLAAVYFLIRGYTWASLREEPSFDLLILLGTMVMPMLAAFPVKWMGLNPIDYQNQQVITVTAIFIVIFAVIALAIGLLWKPRFWLINAAIFYSIFIFFYTTMFTNGFGIITGLVGSLGYWLEQQGVRRGSQPWYYFFLIQIPIYEYLPGVGTLLALVLAGYRKLVGKSLVLLGQSSALDDQSVTVDNETQPEQEKAPVFALLAFWSISSLAAFSYAGEKMPWLTVHITTGMILLAAWAIGYLIDATDWNAFRERRGWLVLLLLPVFLISALVALGSLLGTTPPFQGKDLENLNVTTTFITALVSAIASCVGLYYLIRSWTAGQFNRVMTLFILAFLGVLTVRTAIRAAYINHNNATEYLVYAHSAGGVKEVLSQIEEISRRTTDGLALPVAYDNETAYPFFWYLRDFTDARYYDKNPSRSLREVPIILVDDTNYGKIEPVVGQAYYQFEYTRMWWPDQDYFGLTKDRLLYALTNRQMRTAIFQVWLNRDYKLYSQLVNKDMTLEHWPLVSRMRMYIRKDLAAKLWNYGISPTAQEVQADPYEGKQAKLVADRVIGQPGAAPGQFNRPRDIAVASDGSLYVADTDNHRIQHISGDGVPLKVWGSFADAAAGEAPGGTFNQPWGIAVGLDGSVYVADTWNHRIQKFTTDGQFVKMWGYFGQAEKPEAFWGPRDIAVDSKGRVFITDTGNKRVVVFDADGNFLTQFGEVGLGQGQFDENVGIALDNQGRAFITDTWNQRIQVFTESPEGVFSPSLSWEVVAWYGQSLDNKPFIAMDNKGHVFVTDPEGYRVLEFTDTGEFVQYWGDYSTEADGFGLVGSVAVDALGGVWVSDAGNGRLMHFTLP